MSWAISRDSQTTQEASISPTGDECVAAGGTQEEILQVTSASEMGVVPTYQHNHATMGVGSNAKTGPDVTRTCISLKPQRMYSGVLRHPP